MTDALFNMDDAPRDGETDVLCWFVDDEDDVPSWFEQQTGFPPPCDYNWILGGIEASGYLPLPADASSPSVARTAGEWSDVCAVPDRTELALHVLERLPVEERMQVIAEQMAGLTDGEWSEAMTLIKRKTAEASTND